jgi:hypothetical protein
MAGLEGTIKTPFGVVQKKTALVVGGGVVVLGAIVWYRQRNSSAASTNTTPTDGEIDPATGFAYGSAEDAAALAAQSSYTTPSSSGGSSGVPVNNIGYSTNGQWVQAVITTMTSNGSVSDSTALSAALGKYVTGAYIASGSKDETLVEQAIAQEGWPPVAGTNGYPPSLNRTPPTSTSTGNKIPHIVNLHITNVTPTTMSFAWKHDAVIPDSQLPTVDGGPANYITGTATTYTIHGLKSKQHVTFAMQGLKGNILGPSSTVKGVTK